MVTFIRFGKLGKFPVTPIEITAIYHHTTNAITMTADPLGGRFNDHVCTVIKWPEKVSGGAESIINHQRDVVLFCNSCDCLEIRNTEPGITDRLQVNGLCFFIDL